MATTTVNATYQGYVGLSSNFYIDWVTDIRDAATGSFSFTYTLNTTANSIQAYEVPGRGGGTSGVCSRTFLFFDVSGVPGTITSATLSVLGAISGSLNVITVQGSAWGGDGSVTTLSNGDFSSLSFSNYSDEIYGWSTTGYNDFTLNSSAISEMNDNGYLNIVVIDFDFDYNGVAPGVGFVLRNGVEFLDPTNPIKLTLTYVPSTQVIGISPLLIDKVNGSLLTNISKVVGVS